MSIVESRKILLDKANRKRAAKGLPLFKVDSRLEKSAQAHADYLASTSDGIPHYRLMERLTEAGYEIKWPFEGTRTHENFSEGGVDDPTGITEESLDVLETYGPGEPHYDDFYTAAFNLIGFGLSHRKENDDYFKYHLVIDYGVE